MNPAIVYLHRSLKKTLLFLAFCLALGCGGPTQMTVPATYSPAVTGESLIPLRAGLVLTNNFRTVSASGDYGFMATIGPALTQAAERMVKGAFKDMVVINMDEAAKIEVLQVPAGVDVLVIPVIKNVSAPVRKIEGIRETWLALVVIRWDIVKDGNIIYTNTFTGEYCQFGSKMDESLALALKDHFDKANRGIVSSNWWKAL